MVKNDISFRAIPINKTYVKKLDKKTNKFLICPVNFVKIDAVNRLDLEAIDNVANNWENAKYIQPIATSAHWLNEGSRNNVDIYAITTQQSDYGKLDYDKILCMAEMRDDNDYPKYKRLFYIQVKPNAINVNQKDNKNFKYIGSAMLDSLKQICKNICLYTEKDENIVNFYKRNGFTEYFSGSKFFRWSHDFIEKLIILWDRYTL